MILTLDEALANGYHWDLVLMPFRAFDDSDLAMSRVRRVDEGAS